MGTRQQCCRKGSAVSQQGADLSMTCGSHCVLRVPPLTTRAYTPQPVATRGPFEEKSDRRFIFVRVIFRRERLLARSKMGGLRAFKRNTRKRGSRRASSSSGKKTTNVRFPSRLKSRLEKRLVGRSPGLQRSRQRRRGSSNFNDRENLMGLFTWLSASKLAP